MILNILKYISFKISSVVAVCFFLYFVFKPSNSLKKNFILYKYSILYIFKIFCKWNHFLIIINYYYFGVLYVYRASKKSDISV